MHADKDARRTRRLEARRLETAPLHITRWGDAIVWRGDGFYAETDDGRLVPSRDGIHITRGDVLQ